MKLPRYPKHKASGVEWIGDVPEHWETGVLRRFATMRTGHTPSRTESSYWEDCDIPWFTLADVWQLRDGTRMYLGETKEKISQKGLDNSAAELLPAGTVVFSRTASVGYSGIMPEPMATSQDFWNWIPGPSLTSEYLLFLFRAMSQEFEKLTMGSTHATVYQPDAARLRVCVPSLTEQEAIVRFIKGKTATIDLLVAKKQELRRRLKERRASVATQFITRGSRSSPKRPMQASGDATAAPAAQRGTIALRRACEILDCIHRTVPFVEEGVAVASIGELKGHSIDLSNAKRTTEDEFRKLVVGGRQPAIGDIIFSRNATVGLAALVTDATPRFAMGQDVCLLRSSGDPRYLLYVLRSDLTKDQLEQMMIGSTFRRVNVQQIGSLSVRWPSFEEQRSIADVLDLESRSMRHAVDAVTSAIERLQEYRTALITAAVTGKIDVRNAITN